MKLSIIIVSYNEKRYLPETIESCLRQDVSLPFEIIIGDDGSNDGSIELIEAYHEKYPHIIKYFVMDRSDAIDVIPSIRASNVLKRGFQEASGEYLTVLSGDDLLTDSQKLKKQVMFLETHDEYASCYTDFKYFWDDGKEEIRIVKGDPSGTILWATQYIHISCFVFRRTVLQHLLDRFCDDTGLVFSIFKAGRTKHIPSIAFGYRQRNTSIMHEADPLELKILEVCLCQDVKNQSGLENYSLAHFFQTFRYVFRHRKQLSDIKYHKYRESCGKYSNNYLQKFIQFEDSSILEKCRLIWRIFTGCVFSKIYWIKKSIMYR